MNSMLQKTLSLYVHIPFCARKCNYCDFLSFNAKKEQMDEYFDALEKEISKSAAEYKDRIVTTIFFGGGTPSFADEKRICMLLKKIRDEFDVSENAEISIEVNPASAMRDKLFPIAKPDLTGSVSAASPLMMMSLRFWAGSTIAVCLLRPIIMPGQQVLTISTWML